MDSFSQFGQDHFIDEHVFGGKIGGFFVDIGAHDGVSFSNSYLFEKYRGWTGICVEPMPETFAKLRSLRTCRCVEGCIATAPGRRPFTMVTGHGEMFSALSAAMHPDHVRRIDEAVRTHGGEKRTIDVACYTFNDVMSEAKVAEIDYCSIDTEGSELDILRTIDFARYRPVCFTLEDNNHFFSINRVLSPLGYKLVEKLGTDLVYVRGDQVRRMKPVGLLEFGAKPVRFAKWLARRLGRALRPARR
jgi:FkbM family methyltransferase